LQKIIKDIDSAQDLRKIELLDKYVQNDAEFAAIVEKMMGVISQ
jgi:hypothetical protein